MARLSCVPWAALLVAGTAAAREPAAVAPPPPLTLSWLLAEVRDASPELRALAADHTAALQRVPQAAALDDPTFTPQLWAFPFDRAPGAGSMVMAQLAQPLPFPGKRALRGAVAERTAAIAAEVVRRRDNDLVAEATVLFYELWYNGAATAINRRNERVIEELRRAALALTATGKAGIADVLRAETELARIRTRFANLERDRVSITAAINARINRRADAPLGEPVADFPPPPQCAYDTLLALAEDRRPELAASAVDVRRADTALALAERNRFPDFMPMVMYMHDIEQGPMWGAWLGVTLPIWIGAKQDRAVDEMAASAVASRERQRATRLEVERQVRQALAALTSAVVTLHLLDTEVLPNARDSLEALVAAYVTGSADLTSVLDAQRALQELETELERARSDVEQARAELERTVAGPLPVAAP